MHNWVGEGLAKMIGFIAFTAVIVVLLMLFLNPGDSGLPNAFTTYFLGVFSRG